MRYYKSGDMVISTVGSLGLPEITEDEFNAEMASSDQRAVICADIVKRTNPLTDSEILRLTIRQQVNSMSIPDATASRMVEYFPELTGDGSLIKAGTRINWRGTLKRASVDLWDTAANAPDASPTLWTDIAYRDGIRIIPETITATSAFADGELGWRDGHIYRSGMDGNVWQPGTTGAPWEMVR